MPEELPTPKKSLKQLEKENKKGLKKKQNNNYFNISIYSCIYQRDGNDIAIREKLKDINSSIEINNLKDTAKKTEKEDEWNITK